MKKWIRWKGIGAFFVVVIIFAGLWQLLVDGIVERTIEKMGTAAVGARVELAGTDVSLFPSGLELKRLQITNPDQPMKNAIEVARINLSFNTLHLFERKLVVEEMVLDGVEFNTDREVSGAIEGVQTPAREEKLEQVTEKFKGIPSFALEDVQEILKNEKLESLEQAKRLQEDIKTEKENFQKRLKSLPSKETFADYKRRIDELKGGGGKGALTSLMGKGSEIQTLKKEVETDIKQIKNAQNDLADLKKNLRARINKVTRSPLADVKRIKKKYALTPQGLGNMTALIFGPKYANWVQKGLSWYYKLQPFLEHVPQKEGKPEVVKPVRGKGVNVRFKEHEPKPDVLVQFARSSILIQAGTLSGTLRNITAQQDILGEPLMYEFASDKLKDIKQVNIKGSLNRVSPATPKDTFLAQVAGYNLKNVNLTETLNTPVILENAMINRLNLETIIQGEKITSKLTSALSSARFVSESRQDAGPIAVAIQSALSEVKEFELNADIAGTLDNPSITLSSDLDNVLKTSVENVVKKQTAMFESELKQAIAAKTGGEMKNLKQGMRDFNSFDKELKTRSDLGTNLMKDFSIFGK
jgi:uncharacterized protein (TIGR03545 family)